MLWPMSVPSNAPPGRRGDGIGEVVHLDLMRGEADACSVPICMRWLSIMRERVVITISAATA